MNIWEQWRNKSPRQHLYEFFIVFQFSVFMDYAIEEKVHFISVLIVGSMFKTSKINEKIVMVEKQQSVFI